MKPSYALAALLSLCLLDPARALSQPQRPATPPPSGDINAVRQCAALIATYPPMRPLAPGQACTEMACSSGFMIDMSTVVQPAGSYRIEIEADGQTFTCESRLPFASCDSPSSCTWRRPGTYNRISVTMSGCAMPASQHTMPSIEFEGLCPAHVRARLLRGGSEVGRWESAMTYRRVVANGEGCGPVCAQAPRITTNLHR